jgi:hypothetical protein
VGNLQIAEGSVAIEAADERFSDGIYFDFVECFGLSLLSMGTLRTETRESPGARSPKSNLSK